MWPSCPSARGRRAAVGARSIGRAGPCDVPGRLLPKVDPTRRGAAHPEVGGADLPRRARRRPRSSPRGRLPVRSDGSSPTVTTRGSVAAARRRLSAAVRLSGQVTRLSAATASGDRRTAGRAASGYATAAPRGRPARSTRMPGPIVLAIVRVLRYWPLAPAGLARLTASTRAARLSSRSLRPRSCSCRPGRGRSRSCRRWNSTRPPLTSLDRPLEVERDGPGLGVRHQAAPAEDLAELADQAHRVGRRERDVELEPAGLDLLDQVLAADLVGAGAERLLGLLALGEDRDADDLAGAVREHDRAADHLVGVARIDPEPEVRLDRSRRTRRSWSASTSSAASSGA